MKAPKLLFLLLALLSFSVGIGKEVDPADYPSNPIGTVHWGEPVEGNPRPSVEKTEFAGYVVVVEEFGISNQACLQRLKDLHRLAKKAERNKMKLRIVLIHRQHDVEDADLLDELSRVHPSIMLRKQGWLPIYHEGMPHAAIFNPDGSMAWQNHSTGKEFDKALKEALAKLEEE